VKLSPKGNTSGTTLVEILVATVLLASFFASLFEANALCLRYISASKQAVAGIAAVQDRMEVLRNSDFSSLTTTSYVQGLLGSPANASEYVPSMTEIVQLTAYPTANGTTKITRHTDGSVTVDSTATSLGTSLVKVDVSDSWTSVFNGRSRTEQSSTVISNGSKK
jgi:type II secretory pathway component PulJ